MNADAVARSRIREELDTTMVVVAGAGTGKTTELVERIVRLVGTGAARLRDVAAITFTEAAAAELRERIRHSLVEAAGGAPGNQLLRAALDEVDDAAISTLHAFAERILLEHCAAAGLPSGFEVLDDTADAVDFETRWERFADELLEDPGAEPALVRGFTTGLRHTDLRAVAKALHENWDRLGGRDDGDRRHSIPGGKWPEVDPTAVVQELGRALSLAHLCSDQDDNLLCHLRLVVNDARGQLVAAEHDEEALLHVLASLPLMRCAIGRQENWGGHIEEVREACAAAERSRGEILDSLREAVLSDLLPRLIAFVLRAASERRSEGRITFHDLLVLARDLLRGGGEAVEALRRRYRWILVDEFQDTDPIQVELAARLASESDAAPGLGATRPGGLFVVGDPKQSIYRFRRADIELFERVGTEIGERIVLQTNFRSVPGILEFVNVVFEELFGSVPEPGQAQHHALSGDRGALAGSADEAQGSVQRSVQLSFDQLSQAKSTQSARDPSGGDAGSSRMVRGNGAASASGRIRPPVVVLGDRLAGSAAEVRRRAARDVGECIRRMIEDRWQVADTADGRIRALRFGDVAVLIPTRTSLASLEESFEDLRVPYRIEGASMLWDTEDVRDVLAVLRAVDDPADELSVLAALRSPGLGCGDDDLVSWQARGGRWDPRSLTPDGLGEHAVTRAMAVLDALHRERWWREPSDLIVRAVEVLRSFELAFAYGRPRDHWHRLRWLCDQARLFDETSGGTLRAFLAWAHLQAEGDGGGRAVGPPDPDDDAVRVMTIHGAKGLEFPVVVLAGLERQESDRHQAPAALWAEDGSLEVRAGPLFRTDGYDDAGERDQELDNLERRRLLYVGMTRARDHLVLCLHHRARNGSGDSSLAARLLEICESRPDLWRRLSLDAGGSPSAASTRVRVASPEHTSGDPLDERGGDGAEWRELCRQWTAERAARLSALRRRPVTTASALAEDASQPRPTSGGPGTDGGWPEAGADLRRRAQTSLQIGRAVHGVLATLDLANGYDPSGHSTDDVSRTRAFAHGIGEHAESVTSMVSAALGSSVVRRAASRRHWRELYVAVPVDLSPDPDAARETSSYAGSVARQGLLEGFVDLVFEDDDGLVVVDYKTDRVTSPRGLRTAAALYLPQVAAYAMSLEVSCGRPVSRCVLLFVGSGTAEEQVLEGDELAAARARVSKLVSETLAS